LSLFPPHRPLRPDNRRPQNHGSRAFRYPQDSSLGGNALARALNATGRRSAGPFSIQPKMERLVAASAGGVGLEQPSALVVRLHCNSRHCRSPCQPGPVGLRLGRISPAARRCRSEGGRGAKCQSRGGCQRRVRSPDWVTSFDGENVILPCGDDDSAT
jgi:hypothetical protein